MGGALAEARIGDQFHFNHVFLAAQIPSTGHTPQQPHPRTVRLLFVAQHRDLLWILLLPLELLWTPRLPLVHPQSHLDRGHPSMPSTAAWILSVHPHRSHLDQLVSPLVYQGMLLSSSIFIFLWLCFHPFSIDTGVISHQLSSWFCFTLIFFYLFLFNYCPLLFSAYWVLLVSVSLLVLYLFSILQPETSWCTFSPAHHYPPRRAFPARLNL